jgi:flavorubredoxin
MAKRIGDLIGKKNIPFKIINLQETTISDVVTEVLGSKFIIFGTPILNNRMLPTLAGLLMYLKGLKPKNRFALSFGSYGWSTVGFKEVEESIKEAGFELAGNGKYFKFIPDETELAELDEVAEIVKGKLKK